uniref:Tyrosine-protein kinase n=1 Tax=Mesocestoides corti TaxID=53468 RepID=A0A5K3EWG1_MESCO
MCRTFFRFFIIICNHFILAEKQILPSKTSFNSPGPVEQCIMIVLYDFTATLESQLTVKRGELVRLLGYSPAGDWSEVEAPYRLPNRTPRVAWGGVGSWVRGWVPTSYLTEHVAPCGGGVGDYQRDEVAYPWYHGAVSRHAAEQLLRSGITGSYLVRESESAPGQLSVTVRNLGRVYHYRISRDSSGWFFITETHRFPTVVQLIHHHSQAADGLICPLLYPAAKREQPALRGTIQASSGLDNCGVGLDDWEIDRSEIMMRNKLGWGQYGDVYEALWRRHNSIVAVKTLKQDVNLNLNDFLAEASIMKNLQHKNLVRLLGVCTREPPYYIVTEYMPHGNLLNYLRQRSPGELTPPVLLYMAVQIASGMAYLEANNFIHRDLAARNCLVGEQHTIKVADFGLARYMRLHEDTYTARNGAKFPIKWTAPEGLAYFRFSSKSDVWAFGVVLWELATYGLSPYPGVELHGVYQLLEKGYRMQRPHGCPEPVYNIMLRCWSWEAADRPSFAEVRAELEEMWRTIDMGEAVAEELAKQSALSGNTDHLRQHPHFATDADAHAMAAITSPHQPVQLLSGRKRSRRRHDAGASSPSTSTSSATSVETDGEDGDDESEEAHPLGSEHGVHNSASNWNATRACGNCYQGDYVGGGSGSGGGGVGAPASDLPLPTAGSSSRDSQLSAPACLPSPQQRPAPHAYHGLHQHPHRLHHHRQQQQQHVDFGRVAPRRRGPSHAPKRPDESSLRCPVRQKEKTITPAESGVGESIVSADSPGCDIAPRQRDEETALATSGLRRNHGPTTETGDLPGNSCCPTPTGDLTDGDLAKPMSFSATADDGQVKRGGRLNAEAVTQFTTLPAQDRITRYLESLGELGGTDGERGQQVNRSQQIQLIPDGFPKFPPPPPIPPPAQSHRNLRQSAERHRNQVGRSVSCYQTVPNVQLPVTNCLQQETTPPISLPLSPDTIDRSDVDDPCITPTDDVYQAPNLTPENDVVCEEDEEEEESGLEGSKEHQLTARLNNLSLQANELSSACPQLTTELSALSNQLSACREQIEGRLRRGKTGEGSAAEDQCLMGISQALRQIQQALSNMKARVDSLQPSPFIAAVSS